METIAAIQGNTAASKSKPPQRVKELPVLKDAESFERLAGKAVEADEVDGQESAKHAELIGRVQELEQEVAALRAAAATAVAVAAAAAAAAAAATEDPTDVDTAGS